MLLVIVSDYCDHVCGDWVSAGDTAGRSVVTINYCSQDRHPAIRRANISTQIDSHM